MAYKIEFIKEATQDFERLDKSIQKQISKKIDQLSLNPHLGKPLGNMFNIDLTGFYKLYVSKKQYRIVYRIKSEIIEIIEIVGIGKRDKEAIYRLIHKRLKGHH